MSNGRPLIIHSIAGLIPRIQYKHRLHPLWQKGEEGWKKMALGARFQKLMGGALRGLTIKEAGLNYQRGIRELNSQRRLNPRGLATMFFCEHVISVATLLLIIHVTMYIVIYLMI